MVERAEKGKSSEDESEGGEEGRQTAAVATAAAATAAAATAAAEG